MFNCNAFDTFFGLPRVGMLVLTAFWKHAWQTSVALSAEGKAVQLDNMKHMWFSCNSLYLIRIELPYILTRHRTFVETTVWHMYARSWYHHKLSKRWGEINWETVFHSVLTYRMTSSGRSSVGMYMKKSLAKLLLVICLRAKKKRACDGAQCDDRVPLMTLHTSNRTLTYKQNVVWSLELLLFGTTGKQMLCMSIEKHCFGNEWEMAHIGTYSCFLQQKLLS